MGFFPSFVRIERSYLFHRRLFDVDRWHNYVGHILFSAMTRCDSIVIQRILSTENHAIERSTESRTKARSLFLLLSFFLKEKYRWFLSRKSKPHLQFVFQHLNTRDISSHEKFAAEGTKNSQTSVALRIGFDVQLTAMAACCRR